MTASFSEMDREGNFRSYIWFNTYVQELNKALLNNRYLRTLIVTAPILCSLAPFSLRSYKHLREIRILSPIKVRSDFSAN